VGLLDVCESKDALVCLKATDGGLRNVFFFLGDNDIFTDRDFDKGFIVFLPALPVFGVAGLALELGRLCGDSGVGREFVFDEMWKP